MDFISTIPAEASPHEQTNGAATSSSTRLPQHHQLAEESDRFLTMTQSFEKESHHRDDVSDDASTFTFHPVDAPELEVIVSRIFSISFTTRQVPTPISVSDEEEDLTSESGDDWFLPYYDEAQPQAAFPENLSMDAESVGRGNSLDSNEQGDGDVDQPDEDDEDYVSNNKRKEEPSLDDEQLRKKQRIEEEERRARNELWKKSLKRSMFEHSPPRTSSDP